MHEAMEMNESRFPEGWDAARVQRVLAHYEGQTEDEAVAEDEAAEGLAGQTFIQVPSELGPQVRELVARHQTAAAT